MHSIRNKIIMLRYQIYQENAIDFANHRFSQTQIPQININTDFPKDTGKQTSGNDTGAFTDWLFELQNIE